MRRLLASAVESVFHAGDIPQSHSTRFNAELSASISLNAFTLDSLSGNAPLPRSGMSLNWNATTRTANVQLTTNHAGILDNGWYEATWSDEALPINAEHRHAFRWVQGDLNNDGVVSNQDIGLFLDLLNGSPPASTGPAFGDMNRDGVVNNQDISPFINALVFGVQMPNPLTSPGQLDSWALSSASIRINWTPPIDGTPDGYRIYRSTDGTNFTQVAQLVNPVLLPGGFFWDDTNLSHGTKYWYRVRPFTFAAGNGHTTDKSWSVTVLPAPTPVALEGGDQLVRVVWDDNSDTESAFRITLRRSGSPQQVVVDEVVPSNLVSVAGSRRSWLISGLDSSTSYDVTVAAIRDGGAVSSAPVPFASSVSTNAGQAVPTGGEIIAASASGNNYPGVQWTISPDLTNMNTVLRNDTLTIDVTGLPRHTFARLSLSVDAWTEGNVADGVTFTVRAGTHSATMVRQNDWPGPGAHWTLADTALDEWFEHVGSSMSITITASGFPAERGGSTGGSGTTLPPEPGSYWTLHDFSLSTGIPTVSVVAVNAESASLGGYQAGGPVATVQEGSPANGRGPRELGFWFRRDPIGSSGYKATIKRSGNAKQTDDYLRLPTRVVFQPQQYEVFVPFDVTEDLAPEYTECAGVTVEPGSEYLVPTGEDRRAAIDIEDDDFLYFGAAGLQRFEIDTQVIWDDGTVESIPLPLEDPYGEAILFGGVLDGDFLSWALGRSAYLAAGGHESNPSMEDLITRVLAHQSLAEARPSGPEQQPAQQLDSAGIAAMIAALQDARPGWEVTYDPQSKRFAVSQGPRLAWYDLNLTEVSYFGAGKSWYLRYNDDGSIDRVTLRYDDPGPQQVEQLRMPDRLRRDLQSVYERAVHEFGEERAKKIRDELLLLSEAMEAGLRMLPGATVLDVQEALTGENALRPGIRLQPGERTMSVASAGANIAMIGPAVRLARASQNFENGKQFEKCVLDYLKIVEGLPVPEQRRLIAGVLSTGRVRKTIPDVFVTAHSLIEVKRVQEIPSLTDQLRSQMSIARTNRLRYRLIVSEHLNPLPNFDDLFGDPIRGEYKDLQMTVERYNPNTRTLDRLWSINVP